MSSEPLGRNDVCHCGSGKKYKKCHLADDQAKESAALAKAAEEAAARAAEEAEEEGAQDEGAQESANPSRPHQTDQPWQRSQQGQGNFHGYVRPRRSGG